MPKENRKSASCGCGSQLEPATGIQIEQDTEASRGLVRSAPAKLTLADRWGGWKVRWGIGRRRYRVRPGLYAVGKPDRESVVLVTANFKLSFDMLRRELGGLDAWILVLDTKGINVWCAAGKGTFGTAELIRRIELSGLRARTSRRTLILPQLGASGVAAHEVKRQTGFNVVWGPVRARDIKPFLAHGMKATARMRMVTFSLAERLAVVPVELVEAMKYFLLILAAWTLLNLIPGWGSMHRFLLGSAATLGALLIGALAVPVLLPWIPVRSFALKGWLIGMLWALGIGIAQDLGAALLAGSLLLLPAVSAFLALNFTGSTTFTSQTGVNKEIRLFARPIAISALAGILLLVGGSVW